MRHYYKNNSSKVVNVYILMKNKKIDYLHVIYIALLETDNVERSGNDILTIDERGD